MLSSGLVVLGFAVCFCWAQTITIQYPPISAAGLTARSAPTNLGAGSVGEIPENGIDIYLSDNVYSSILSALGSSGCNVPNTDACSSALASAIGSAKIQANQLQVRQVGLAIAGIGALLANFIAIFYTASKPPPKVIHFTSAEISAAANIATASSILAVTSTYDGTLFALPTPPPVTASVTISIAPQASGESSGDLHILMQDSQAAALQSIMDQAGICQFDNSKSKRQQGSAANNCVYQAATALLYNAKAGMAYSTLALVAPAVFPSFVDAVMDAWRLQFVGDVLASGVAAAFKVTTSQLTAIANEWFYEAYIYISLDVALAADSVIPSLLLTTTKPKVCNEGMTAADTDLICSGSYCLGDPVGKLCTVNNEYQGCPCMNMSPLPRIEVINIDMMERQPNALMQWLAGAGGSPTTTTPKYPQATGDALVMLNDLMARKAPGECGMGWASSAQAGPGCDTSPTGQLYTNDLWVFDSKGNQQLWVHSPAAGQSYNTQDLGHPFQTDGNFISTQAACNCVWPLCLANVVLSFDFTYNGYYVSSWDSNGRCHWVDGCTTTTSQNPKFIVESCISCTFPC